MTRPTFTLIAVAAGLAAAGAANAATIMLSPQSPANGAVLGPQDAPYRVVLGWTADPTGCQAPPTDAKIVVSREGATNSSEPVNAAPYTDSFPLTIASLRPVTYTWYARMTCVGAPNNEVVSETRTFTVQGNPPRLEGSFRVTVHGTPQVWQFTPRCPAGACDTVMTRKGQRGALLAYNPATWAYRGRFRVQSLAPERVCTIKTTLGGKVLRKRTIENVYAATNGTLTLSPRGITRSADGARALSAGFVGRQVAQYRYTKRGRSLGCPRGSRAAAPLVGTLR
ncbi:MAG: hypothetical protein KDC33_11780 [Thermoleophilia bacterium]|nr:hypothetical protein [Thermoleophilia bacterium]